MRKQDPIRSRAVIVAAVLGCAACGIAWRLVTLQIFEADHLRARARRQHEQVIEVGGQRGSILDRNGRELAVSLNTQSLYAHPSRIKDPDRLAHLIAPYLGRPEQELRTQLRSDEPFVWLKRRIDPVQAKPIAELDPQIGHGGPIDFQEEPKRFYPQGALGVHIVGATDTDQHGTAGIEKKYDDALQGDSTKFLAVRDAKGAMLLQQLRPPAKRSGDVVLTIDLVLQHIVERELDRAMEETGARAATAIVVDPKTGQVLALANRPTVDAQSYGKGSDESRRNRAVESLYEPGSTFKLVSASAAIERGTVTPEQRFDCSKITVAGKTYTDVHKFGVLSVREILEHSSNVGMVQVGRTVPKEFLRETIVNFGFGRKTGIELPGERNGNITSLARMSLNTPCAFSIGYEIDVTPLQIVQAYAAIANDGVLNPMRIVLGTRDENGTVTPVEAPEPRRVVSSRTAASMTNMLEGVVIRGTGENAKIPGYHIAGKTGTAKKVLPGGGGYTEHEYFASFGGFGPLNDPRLCAFVVLDTPRGSFFYGGQVAAPVFERIVADGLAYLRVPPDDDPWQARRDELKAAAEKKAKAEKGTKRKDEEKSDGPALVETASGQVPDVRGKTAREAIAALVARGYRARVEGDGVVVRVTPAAGTPLAAGQACVLHLGDPKAIEKDPAPLDSGTDAPTLLAARKTSRRAR
ncbi:MAG TPA: penicillin-binding protein [Candidatus Polarisedimenticolaceae bacterium]|nr:penicillin-binding protein [Candidatus Polarisedimenticolaceae bacterium]